MRTEKRKWNHCDFENIIKLHLSYALFTDESSFYYKSHALKNISFPIIISILNEILKKLMMYFEVKEK